MTHLDQLTELLERVSEANKIADAPGPAVQTHDRFSGYAMQLARENNAVIRSVLEMLIAKEKENG